MAGRHALLLLLLLYFSSYYCASGWGHIFQGEKGHSFSKFSNCRGRRLLPVYPGIRDSKFFRNFIFCARASAQAMQMYITESRKGLHSKVDKWTPFLPLSAPLFFYSSRIHENIIWIFFWGGDGCKSRGSNIFLFFRNFQFYAQVEIWMYLERKYGWREE